MKKSVLRQKFKDIRFKLGHKLFVFKRRWVCHPVLGYLYPSIKLPTFLKGRRGGSYTKSKRFIVRIFAVIMILIISIPAFLYFFHPTQTQAAWWDDSFAYRQKITFVHNADLTNASMRLTVSNTNNLITPGKMQPDCDDSRFTDSSGKVLRYILVSGCNAGTTVYDVEFPTVLNGTNLAYFYYGNPSAFSMSDSSIQTGTTPSAISFAEEEKGPAPVLYFKFDEGTGSITKDSSSNGNNGGIVGASWQTQKSCLSDNCLFFDGIDDQVIGTNAASIDFDQGLASGSAFQAWVKVNSAGENNVGRIFDKGNATYLRVANSVNGKVDLEGRIDLTTTDSLATASAALTLNKWHLVTMTYTDDGDDEISLYIDGKLVATGSGGSGAPATDASDLLIGGASGSRFQGYMDDFKIYHYERSAEQVKTDSGHIPSSHGKSASVGDDKSFVNNGLIAHYAFEEIGPYANATDSTGNGFTLTNNNSTASTSGKFGNGAWFNASANNYFSTTTDINNINSVSFWASPSATADQFISLTNGSIDITSNNSSIIATGFTNPKVFVNGVQNGTYNTIAWNHIVVISATAMTATDLWIGRTNAGYMDSSKIDDVRLYNRPLSPSEVARLYDWGPGPVGWWKLDENTGATANDSSGNNNTGTLTNGPFWTTGKVGGAIKFDGGDDYVDVPDNPILSITGALTLEGWYRYDGKADDWGRVFGKAWNSNAAPWASYVVNLDNGAEGAQKFIFGVYQSASTYCETPSSNTIPKIGQWLHIAGVFEPGAACRLYINGVKDVESTTAMTTLADTTGNFRLARDEKTLQISKGLIDDVRIYNYARSTKQIISDINAGHPAVGSPVGSAVGYWKFNEGYGTTAYNSGSDGNNLNGALTNMDSPATYGSGWTSNGKFGKALVFDGANDYVDAGNPASAQITSDLTLSSWVYLSSNTANQDIIAKRGLSSQWGYRLWVDSSGYPKIDVSSTGNVMATASASQALSVNRWYHITGTYNPSQPALTIYVDGVQKGQTTSSVPSSLQNSTSNLNIGREAGTVTPNYLKGSLDEVKLYNYALSADEVKVEYNQGKAVVMGALSTSDDGKTASNSASRAYCVPGDTSTCNPPVGEWKLDENAGTTVNDTSGNGYTSSAFTGNVAFRPGKFGSGLYFDGVDDVVRIPEGPKIDVGATTDSYTVTAWYRTTTTKNSCQAIVMKSDISNNSVSYPIKLFFNGLSNSGFGILDSIGPTVSVTATGPVLNDGKWHYLAGIRNATAYTVSLYSDGINTDTKTDTTNSTISNDADISIGNGGLNYTACDFEGSIDDVRIYNYARTPAQIAWDYNRGGPVAWYKFNECQGSTAHDSSGNRLDSTINAGDDTGDNDSAGSCNSGASGTTNEMWNAGTTGKFNASLGFDGTNDYASTSGTIMDATSQKTYSSASWGGWFYKTDAAADTLLEKNHEFRLTTDSSNIPSCSIWTAGGWSTAVVSSAALSSSTWQNVLCIYDGTNIKIYINGIQKGTTTQSAAIMSLNYTPLTFGHDFVGSAYYSGQIDDVRIFNYALTPVQVKLLYNDNSAVRFAPLTGSP